MTRTLCSTQATSTVDRLIDTPTVQVAMAVRLDELILVARIRLGEEISLESAGDAVVDQQIEGFRQWGQDFLQGVADRIRPAIEAPLREENRRLRSALESCLQSCSHLLELNSRLGTDEGMEAQQAEAWLALERARDLLEETEGDNLLTE